MAAANNNLPADGAEGLDELLDSCLDDFDKPLPKPVSSVPDPKPIAAAAAANSESKTSSSGEKLPEDGNWGEEFKQFQDVMENFLENESDLNELRNLLGNINGVGDSNVPLDLNSGLGDNLDQSFLDTIRDLTEGAQNIPEMSPESVAEMFSSFSLNEPSTDDPDQLPDLMPLMHNVMQRLMSKELLYPSLKEIADKYPSWLAEKQSSLKTEEYEKYSQQFNLMKTVCDEFESENECDTDEEKKKRFEKVLVLMQKIQNYGNPPKELVSNIGQNVPLDEFGNLQIPGMPQQCAIM